MLMEIAKWKVLLSIQLLWHGFIYSSIKKKNQQLLLTTALNLNNLSYKKKGFKKALFSCYNTSKLSVVCMLSTLHLKASGWFIVSE